MSGDIHWTIKSMHFVFVLVSWRGSHRASHHMYFYKAIWICIQVQRRTRFLFISYKLLVMGGTHLLESNPRRPGRPRAGTLRTSSSTEWMSCAKVGSAGRTCSKLGCGLPRQKFDRVQVALRSIDSFDRSVSCWSRGPIAPCWRTRSRHTGESPAMLPSAHTCSQRKKNVGGGGGSHVNAC